MAPAKLAAWAGICLSILAGDARALAATQVLVPSEDTFLNSGNPANNNGGTASIFTGTDGHGGIMRGLIQFAMPADLLGRVTVTSVQLAMTVEALGNGTSGTPAVESLQALAEPWAQGNGVGDAPSTFTVGQPCGGAISGATWTRSDCTTGTSWTTAGGTVTGQVSGVSDTTGVPIGGQVTWSSASNPRMTLDVQSWMDAPASNHGWRIASSTEGVVAAAQRFFSTEAGLSPPSLAVTYSCKSGFVSAGNGCVAVTAVPAAGPFAMLVLAGALGALSFVVLRRHAPRARGG